MFKIFAPFQKVPKEAMTLLQTKLNLLRKNDFSFRPFLDILLIHSGARKFVSHLKIAKMSLINILKKDCGLQYTSEKYRFEVKHPVLRYFSISSTSWP